MKSLMKRADKLWKPENGTEQTATYQFLGSTHNGQPYEEYLLVPKTLCSSDSTAQE